MEIMDIDLDLEEDKIKTFLLNKLSEVKYSNDEFEKNLKARTKFVNEEFEEHETDAEIRIVSPPWSKFFYNRYAFGIRIECDSSETYSANATITWDSKCPLSYKVFTFHEFNNDTVNCCHRSCDRVTHSVIESQKIKKAGYLIIVIDRPLFSDKLELSLSGFITASWDNPFDNPVVIDVPPIRISASDHTSYQLFNRNLIDGNKEDIMAYLACSAGTNFTMVLPDIWDSELDSTFEIHCSLTKSDLKLKCKRMYLAYKVTETFDGTAITVHSIEDRKNLHCVTVYSRDHRTMIAFLHHLYSNIPGVLFIPSSYRENYVNSLENDEDVVNKLNECLKNEVKWVHRSLKASSTRAQFRNKLCDIEYETDKLYLKVCRNVDDL